MLANRFRLAPMSRLIAVFTAGFLLLPIIFLVIACKAQQPYRILPLYVGFFLVASCVAVWLWFRPSYFEIDEQHLKIKWPLRSRLYKRSEIIGAEIIDQRAFRAKYGRGMRVGVGGLWGAFGLFVTGEQNFDLYVSRTDVWVIVRRASGRPLLITPEHPEKLVGLLMN